MKAKITMPEWMHTAISSTYQVSLDSYLYPDTANDWFVRLEIAANPNPKPGSSTKLLYVVFPNGGRKFVSSIYPASKPGSIGEINFYTASGRHKFHLFQQARQPNTITILPA